MSQQTRSEQHKQALEQFVLLWGEMASAWGINKTMAQIHALLYAEADPLDTDTIMEQLDISRGNANMNLRNLLNWQLIHKVHFKGKRKDYYTAEKDVWNIVSTIVRERQQREVAPIRQNLQECLEVFEAEGGAQTEEEQEFRERIENFMTFLEMFERFTSALLPYINKNNLKFLKQLVKLAELKESMKGKLPDTIKLPVDDDQ
ncbi:GbsR/MarR family transcriptional regulator [Halalkalibaculum sp. DA3122]|uniref:GbsR/MarR family transcriptional regulator n=1 Tax=unclassified Halalkalibaculum TaxID=2964617 RepID=UPI003754CFEE